MLGAKRLSDLKRDLQVADDLGITWKFVFLPEPIQHVLDSAQSDGWPGYPEERAEILRFIDNQKIGHVVFVSGDIHASIANNLVYQTSQGERWRLATSSDISAGPAAHTPIANEVFAALDLDSKPRGCGAGYAGSSDGYPDSEGTAGQARRPTMPLHLEPLDVSGELERATSVLIVSCPVCPPVSLAIQRSSPFMEVFKSGLKTGAFEDLIAEIRQPLERRGVRTDVVSMYAPLPTMCLWTRGQRRRLLERAKDFDTVLVLGCDSATYTVREALEETQCRVIQAMHMTGITNAVVKFRLPMTVTLEEKARVGAGEETSRRSTSDCS
jgi:hypothetical protein